MKKTGILIIFLCGLLAFSGAAMALTINNTTNVGIVDTIHASGYIFPPNDENEVGAIEGWIQDELGEDYYISGSYNVSAGDWTKTDQNENAYALRLKGTPEFFFIWLATNPQQNTPEKNAFLYLNKEELAWAVVDITEWLGYTPPGGDVNIGRISHVREIGVPEPATMLLLGTGLLGLVVARRRFKK